MFTHPFVFANHNPCLRLPQTVHALMEDVAFCLIYTHSRSQIVPDACVDFLDIDAAWHKRPFPKWMLSSMSQQIRLHLSQSSQISQQV